MKQRLTMFFACLFLSIGMALAQSRLTGTVTSARYGHLGRGWTARSRCHGKGRRHECGSRDQC